MHESESRGAPRKILRQRVKVVVSGGRALAGRTIDISTSGIGITLDESLSVGQSCMVLMDVLIGGVSRQFHAEAKVVYSICSGTTGFRTGLQFAQLSTGNAAIVNALP